MEMWLTIAAAVAVAGMCWDLALRFGPDHLATHDESTVTSSRLVSREEPAA